MISAKTFFGGNRKQEAVPFGLVSLVKNYKKEMKRG